jgi:hypothetical protein
LDQVKKIAEQLRVVLSNPIPGFSANVSLLVSTIPKNWISGGDVTEDMDLPILSAKGILATVVITSGTVHGFGGVLCTTGHIPFNKSFFWSSEAMVRRNGRERSYGRKDER